METNGHQTDPLDALRAYAEEVASFSREEAAKLGEGLAREQRLQAEIKSLLEDSQQRERGLRRAVEALTPGEHQPTTRPPSGGKGKNWVISQAKVQGVWDKIRARGGDNFKASDLRGAGTSGESVRRSIQVLRERELVRVAGSLRGGGKLYALMPGAMDVEDLTPADSLWSPGHGS